MIERRSCAFCIGSIVLKTKTHYDILKWIKYGLLSVALRDLYQI